MSATPSDIASSFNTANNSRLVNYGISEVTIPTQSVCRIGGDSESMCDQEGSPSMSRKRPTKTQRARKPRPPRATGRSKRRPNKPRIQSDERLETALRYLREGRSQKRAAEIGMVSVARFRRFLHRNKLAKFKNRRWRITDRRKRQVAGVFRTGEEVIEVSGFSPASLIMRHRATVQHFLDSNDVAVLTPFEGLTVTDTSKQKHVLETRPNVLLRLANAGSDAEMKIYRLID